jgi:hypothetical protein
MPLQLYKIESVEVGSAGAANITFSSIPSGYTDLKLVLCARTSAASANDNFWLMFNSTSTTYSERSLYGSGTAAASGNSSGTNVRYLGPVPGATSTASTFGNSEIYIPNYASSNQKSVSIDGVAENNATAAYSQIQAVLWSGTAAITAIQIGLITGNFVQYTTATLYGIL